MEHQIDNFLRAGWLGLDNFLESKNFRKVPLEVLGNGGHGDTLSVKVVLPTFCQAKCRFCFNRYTAETQCHNWDIFFSNFETALKQVFMEAGYRRISIDITGGEPTFNPEKFQEFLRSLKTTIYEAQEQIQSPGRPVIDKVVLTTNGYRLEECMDMFEFEIIDIVNISLHHYNYLDRQNIFGTKFIPSNGDLFRICEKLRDAGKKVTAVAVVWDGEFLHPDYPKCTENNFRKFVGTFAHEISLMGFHDGRIRLDYMDTKGNADLFAVEFPNESLYMTPALQVKSLNHLDLPINIYKGVPDISEFVVGPELIVDDNGMLYLDYIKEKPIRGEEVAVLANAIFINE